MVTFDPDNAHNDRRRRLSGPEIIGPAAHVTRMTASGPY
jgi:hypothetical protein